MMNRRQLELADPAREQQAALALQCEELGEVLEALADLLMQVMLEAEEREEAGDECDR